MTFTGKEIVGLVAEELRKVPGFREEFLLDQGLISIMILSFRIGYRNGRLSDGSNPIIEELNKEKIN